jgi:cephalosporin-C deacetylase-like acetyl esterase
MRKLLLLVFLCLPVLISFATYSTGLSICSAAFNPTPIHEKEPGTVVAKIVPHQKNALFDAKHPVKYNVVVFNNYNTVQEGKIAVEIKNAQGGLVGTSEVALKLKGGSNKKLEWKIPIKEPGFYDITVKINLTEYDDTIRNVFGYKPYEINTPLHKPADFEAFWQKAKDDLNAVNPDYSITPDNILSTPTHQVYYVEMNSLDNVRITGWLTVPKAKGKYPVLYGLGGYKVEMKPLFFDDFAHFTINVRGIGESNKKINPDNTELLVLHLEDKNKYVYRGIYMDCLRGLDFIIANEKMGLDISRIGLFGGSQGGTLTLVLASLSRKTIFCVLDNPTYCDFHTNYDICVNRFQPEAGFIIKFLKEYLRRNSSVSKEKMLTTLSYFESQNFVSEIKCPVLLGLGLLDLMAPPTCTFSAYNKLSAEVKKKSEVFSFPSLAHEVPMQHNTYKSTWFYENAVNKLSH